jgi:large subunit ribosomal protein L25
VQQGEKVTVEIPVVITGEAQPGTLVTQDASTLQVAVEALHIPEQFEVSISGATAGTQILASDVPLLEGAELVTDPDTLVIAINVAPTAEDMEAGIDAAEGAEAADEAAPATEAAEEPAADEANEG